MVKEINDANFNEEVNGSGVPVVVDFWAPWCGPCKMLSPVMDEVAEDMGQKAKFVKVNVDNNPVVANQFRIASIPTVLVFKDGKMVDNMIGFKPKSAVKSIVEKHI